MPRYSGASEQYKPSEQRVDTRRLTQRLRDSWINPDGGYILATFLTVGGFFSVAFPLFPIIFSIPSIILSKKFLSPKNNLHDMPYRIPKSLNMPDGSRFIPEKPFKQNKSLYLGKGETMYGKDLATNLQVWANDDDDRVHSTVLGTTGSGKTEFIFCLVLNQLIHNSGFIAIDAKGDISFQRRTCQLLRRLGREDDLLTISFAVGDRDLLQAQEDKSTNTFNLMSSSSLGMLIELLSGLLDGEEDVWKGRALAFIACVTQPLVYLRDKKEINLSPQKYMEYMELAEIERLVSNEKLKEKYDGFDEVLKPLRGYLLTLPGYDSSRGVGMQEQQTNEQFGYITMQLTRAINDLGYNYGHIFGVDVGEIDISDVVLNRRCLTGLLPSLERSPSTLNMLGRLLIGSIKQMMAGSLGNKLEGLTRINVDSRPTSARNSFRVILDEVGYIMVTGMSVIPAQARSLNISITFAAQSYTDIKRGSAEEAEAIWDNSGIKFIGRIVGGENSETWERVSGASGTQEQMSFRNYERYESSTGFEYRSGDEVNRERLSQASYDDISTQQNGEFTLIAPKKIEGGRAGQVAVVHFLGIYTAGGAELPYMYMNDLVPISISDIKQVNVDKQKEKIKEHLINGTLSNQFYEALATQKDLSRCLNGEQMSERTSLEYFIQSTQEEMLIHENSANFVNMSLEITLSKLYETIRGFENGFENTIAFNRIDKDLAGKDANDWAEELSTKATIATVRDYSHHEFSDDAVAQSQHIKPTQPIPEDIRTSSEKIREEEGRAVDLTKDKGMQQIFSKYNDGVKISSLFSLIQGGRIDENYSLLKQSIEEDTYKKHFKNPNLEHSKAYKKMVEDFLSQDPEVISVNAEGRIKAKEASKALLSLIEN